MGEKKSHTETLVSRKAECEAKTIEERSHKSLRRYNYIELQTRHQ